MTAPYRIPWLRPLFLWWWRIHERDVLDARETTGGKAAPDYEHGKVTGLRPDLVVITETTESPYVCCGYCSAAMAVRAARQGTPTNMAGAAHPIRSQGGRPHDNGSRASELRDGARRAWDVELDPLARDEIPGRLRAGYAVVVNLDYADLPGWLKTQGGSFGHSSLLFGWREDGDLVGYFDPLYGQGARGAWAPWGSIKPALWGDGEHSSTVERWDPEPEPEPPPTPAPEPVPEPTYTLEEVAVLVELAAERAVTISGDVLVGAWLAWLRAPRSTLADRWGAGAWADPEAELEESIDADEELDPCGPGAPASWSRGPLLPPVRDALGAMFVPASWDGSAWRAGAWR
jgi:hypothetical protein